MMFSNPKYTRFAEKKQWAFEKKKFALAHTPYINVFFSLL